MWRLGRAVIEEDEEEEEESKSCDRRPRLCGKGHRSSLLVETPEGGAICLVCFSNLLSDPSSPTHHVSYALSQISLAQPKAAFLRSRHGHLLVSPLVHALSSFDDDALARQVFDLVSDLCSSSSSSSSSEDASLLLARDFITRIVDQLLLRRLAWSRRQLHLLHCLGILLDRPQTGDHLSARIRDVAAALVPNLVGGLQIPSDEIRGEILFVLYKLSQLQDFPWDYSDDLSMDQDKLLGLALETLLKTQSDDVRLNCIALLTVLSQKGQTVTSWRHCSNSPSREQHNLGENGSMLAARSVNLFSDAIKGPLLSSDPQVQISALNLIFHSFQSDASQINVLNEECVTDYVFEILRLSEKNDCLIISCLRTLDILARAEESFKPRLAIGFPILLSSLHYVAEIPLHPVQPEALKLVSMCVTSCPGVISISQLEDLSLVLAKTFKLHTCGELGMLSKTFVLACLTFVEVLNLPSAFQLPKIATLIQQASRDAVLSVLPQHKSTDSLLHALYLLKEAYRYLHDESFSVDKKTEELGCYILEVCETHLLPWFKSIVDQGIDEDAVLGILETFNFILIQGPDSHFRRFAKTLAYSSWLTLSFSFLGLFPTDRMKWRVYLMLSSVVDGLLGEDSGRPIRESYLHLPLDPLELIFLLGQKSNLDASLVPIQSAVILILYVSSLLDERIADENQILASLEQFILVNGSNFSTGIAGSMVLTQFIHLYGFVRGSQVNGCFTSYSRESEKLLFHLISENEWDLVSTGIHPVSLKWLFQQEPILPALSAQILNFCRCHSTEESQVIVQAYGIHLVDIHTIAEVLVCGDNYLALLFVSLLKSSQEQDHNDDIFSVINVIEAILAIFPDASNQLCTNRIDAVIRNLYFSHLSNEMFRKCLILVFNILHSVQAVNLHDGECWLSVTVKLLEDVVPSLIGEACSGREACLILSIFSLVLHHSINQVLLEASRSILLNSSLICAINIIIKKSCAKGPALVEHEDTLAGELLIFVLLLHLNALRSIDLETLCWQDFLESKERSKESAQQYLVFCILCDDLCRLVHFGFPSIKLIASQCLVELFTRISYQRKRIPDELRCSVKYLQSIIAVTEGLLFFEDSRVSTNCALCLSMILGWGNLGTQEKRAIKNSKWFRLITEEFSLSLAAPSFASKLFISKHKPAIHVAIALLRVDQFPSWLNLAFDAPCISGIINKLSASNLNAEMVQLFRELLAKQLLNKEHISALLLMFQACRRYIYSKKSTENSAEEIMEKVITDLEETGKIFRLLIHLMLPSGRDCSPSHTKEKRLFEEIELFIEDSARE